MYSNDTTEALSFDGLARHARRAARVAVDARWARAWTAACVVLGLCLMSPAIGTGLVADDFLHALMLRDDAGVRGLAHQPLDLFRFADGHPPRALELMNEGVFPWWANREAKLAFFRPLASLSHWLDYRLWPDRPALMHLHSLAWFGLTIALVAALYRRLGAARNGLSLATLLFAIDDAHAPLVGWIANRNALIALCLALPALLVHDRWRRDGWSYGAWLGPLLFGLGLCAGETAVGVLPYLLAYAICLDHSRWWARFGALAPYLLVALAWKACCVVLGYGVAGSGLYVDPLAHPLAFLGAACERLPVLGLALVGAPFADLWELYPLLSPWLRVSVLLAALIVLGAFGNALRPLMAKSARLHFWAVGAALSLLPMCATFPHDRLLLGPGIGAMVLVAALIRAGWARRAELAPALGMAVLVAVHLILAPVLAPVRAAGVGRFTELLRASDETLPAGPDVRAQTLVLMNPPLDPFAAYLPVYRQVLGQPRPRQQLWLATGVSDVEVQTLDAHSIAVRQQGGFVSTSMQRMLRSVEPGMERDPGVHLDGVDIFVTERTRDHRPLEIVVRFERELRDPSLSWQRWMRTGYAPFELPAPGHAVLLPRAALGALLFSS